MSKAEIYSDLKMPWWIAREGIKYPPVPKHVQIIIASICNMSCSFCAYRQDGYSSNELFTDGVEVSKYGHNNPQRVMDTERALRLVQEVKDAGCLSVEWTGGGEVTAHKDHERILQSSIDAGLLNALVSNGLKWSPNLIKNILPKFDWVRVSIDAGTAETFARTRQTPETSFGRVLLHTTQLATEIAAQDSECVLGTGYVVTPENWQELVEGVRLAKLTGAKYVRLAAMFSNDGTKPYEPIFADIKRLIGEAQEKYECDTFKVVDLFRERIQDLMDGKPEYTGCPKMWFNTYVADDLWIYKCCVTSFSKWGRLTSIKDQTFGEAWKEALPLMQNHDSHGCPPCQFNLGNRAALYMLNAKPPHVEWP